MTAEIHDRYTAAVLDSGTTVPRHGSPKTIVTSGEVEAHDGTHALGLMARISEEFAAWTLLATLAWAEFPLGSNRPWSWSLLVLLVCLAWALWLPRALAEPDALLRSARHVLVPGVMLLAVLVWAALQAVPWTPAALHNGLWQVVQPHAERAAQGAISVNPYETATEAMKLGAYIAVGFLAYALAQRHEIARRIFVGIAVIGACYAVYGLYLSAIGSSQLFVLTGRYSPYGNSVAGGFVSKNSFATFDAIALVVCAVLIGSAGGERLVLKGALRRFGLSLMQFLLGRFPLMIIAAATMFVALVLANSRAGLIAGISGLLVLFGFAVILSGRRRATGWAIAAGAAALSAMVALFALSGDTVAARFDQLVETGGGAELRPVMWSAATRSIFEHPWMGTGLGTFGDVYPLYADRFVPYVIDRAHSDYLEFALGVGIPAAIVWWSALGLLAAMCTIGAVKRRRRRAFAVAAVGAAAVVAVHSVVDFSLQMPAVSLLFAVVLGTGLAQSSPTPKRARVEGGASWMR